MRVFISWSGATSKAVAEALREWLPFVVNDVEPWVSSEDIAKGVRWSTEISTALAASSAGIICLTRDNTEAPWLMFEAGALSKSFEASRVCTYLFRVEPTNLAQGPLTQFQHTKAEKNETAKLVKSINAIPRERAIPEDRLLKQFEVWWQELERKLGAIPDRPVPQKRVRSLDEKVDEILLMLRELARERMAAAPSEEITKMLLGTDVNEPFANAQVRAALFNALSAMRGDANRKPQSTADDV